MTELENSPAAAEADPPRPVYDSVEAWVTGRFIPMYRRPIGGEFRWCARWWRHAEAISRLTVLWHTWERLRLEPHGIATWYAAHLDHHLPQLLSSRGPFYQCSDKEHIEPRALAAEPAPPGWWDLSTPPQDNAETARTDIAGDHVTPPPSHAIDDEGEGP